MKNEKQKNTNEKRLSRKTIISLVAVVLVFAAVSVAMIPLIRLLSSEHGQEIIIEKMQSFGIFAPLLFVLLQVLQVVVAVIPGGPVPIIGGILFGQWGGLFLSLAGFFLGTVLVLSGAMDRQTAGRPFCTGKSLQEIRFSSGG